MNHTPPVGKSILPRSVVKLELGRHSNASCIRQPVLRASSRRSRPSRWRLRRHHRRAPRATPLQPFLTQSRVQLLRYAAAHLVRITHPFHPLRFTRSTLRPRRQLSAGGGSTGSEVAWIWSSSSAAYMAGMIPHYRMKLPVFYELEVRDWKSAATREPVAGSPPPSSAATSPPVAISAVI